MGNSYTRGHVYHDRRKLLQRDGARAYRRRMSHDIMESHLHCELIRHRLRTDDLAYSFIHGLLCCCFSLSRLELQLALLPRASSKLEDASTVIVPVPSPNFTAVLFLLRCVPSSATCGSLYPQHWVPTWDSRSVIEVGSRTSITDLDQDLDHGHLLDDELHRRRPNSCAVSGTHRVDFQRLLHGLHLL